MKKVSLLLAAIFMLTLGLTTINGVDAATIIDQMNVTIDKFDLPSSCDGAACNDADETVQGVVGKIISAFLSFLGVVFMVLIVYGGFRWMMARGAEEEIKKAKDIIRGAVIGLIITMAAYAIAYFVAFALQEATK